MTTIASLIHHSLGSPADVAVMDHAGNRAGPDGATSTLKIVRTDAYRRILQRPGELGVARAFVAGDLDVDGDIFTVLDVGFSAGWSGTGAELGKALVAAVGWEVVLPVPPPPEEAQVRGHLHSKERDRQAISHHYDVSNEFYRMVLGPAMTYSCAVFETPTTSLEDAQANKHELVSQKLGLQRGMRLLDVGCGWGSMLIHAATHHGVSGVGITIAQRQAELAEKRAAEAGVGDLIEIRLQDYRDIDDGPYDAISSIGMFEHVGRAQLPVYHRQLFELLRPGGRLLDHGICRPIPPHPSSLGGRAAATARRVGTAVGLSLTSRIRSPLMERYVFPDAELHEVGTVVTLLNEEGFEVRHVEDLREHYALTLRAWVRNLESSWDAAVAAVGAGRARVWRLYMAACALGFEHHFTEIHQVLAVKLGEHGSASFPLRPEFPLH
ncbi:MAG TPA: cyclopropane-fatty-acyl-phospholipid synthase family protein [Microthrixaceae bacterium]|nr:cyclopropane-fatty-acyl-phospholipid synthase family protein [Microthrixaceae bacterium]